MRLFSLQYPNNVFAIVLLCKYYNVSLFKITLNISHTPFYIEIPLIMRKA